MKPGLACTPPHPPLPRPGGRGGRLYVEGIKEGLACPVSLQLCLQPHVWPVGRVELPDLLHPRATLGRVRRAGSPHKDGSSSPFPVPYKLGDLERPCLLASLWLSLLAFLPPSNQRPSEVLLIEIFLQTSKRSGYLLPGAPSQRREM